MGIFGNLFGKRNEESVTTNISAAPSMQDQAAPGILNLTKGSILNLTKTAPSLVKVHAAAGWDVSVIGGRYDLDLCAFMKKANGGIYDTIYYGNRNGCGINLDKDNLTGSGDGDDENIYVDLPSIPADVTQIIFAVVIYDANSRHQSFKHVKNAYVRLIDDQTGNEMCRYMLNEDGGNNTAVIMGSLNRDGSDWIFEAIGEYSVNSIDSLERHV